MAVVLIGNVDRNSIVPMKFTEDIPKWNVSGKGGGVQICCVVFIIWFVANDKPKEGANQIMNMLRHICTPPTFPLLFPRPFPLPFHFWCWGCFL